MHNKVTLVGRLTADIVLKKTNTGKSVASFTLACDRRKAQGQDKAITDFISIQAWEGRAETLKQYSRKGDKLFIEGRIATSSYEDAVGKKVYVTEVVVEGFELFNFHKSAESKQPQTETPKEDPHEAYYPDEGFNTGPLLDIASDDLPF